MTDAANEAKDNVKYLATLEKSLEPMFHGTVQDITDTLPALMNNIRVRRGVRACTQKDLRFAQTMVLYYFFGGNLSHSLLPPHCCR